jgi:hypothetical protein
VAITGLPTSRRGEKARHGQLIIAAALELEGVDADLVLPLFRQSHGEGTLVAGIVHFHKDLVIVLGPGFGQLQDRVEFPTGDVGDDGFALFAVENPAVDLALRQESAELSRAAQVVHRHLSGGRKGDQRQDQER